jgi:hypothetical protein
MKTLHTTLARGGWTRRTLALALLLAGLAGAAITLTPAPASAGFIPPPCNKYVTVTRYYSDASKTTQVGYCINDQCAGSTTCSGTKTSYVTFSATRCSCDV